jgi:2-polyprenyl-3-methyl-5-hydroxy-6-metoxy-1,4-benzoquinol methylase
VTIRSSRVSETSECYVCRSTRVRSFTDLEGFTHVLCRNCHLVRLDDSQLVPSTKIYTPAYFSGQLFEETSGRLGYAKSYADPVKSHRAQQYGQYADELAAELGPNRGRPLRVLDFGCSYGAFLTTLLERMEHDVEVHGIEVNPEVCEKASSRLNGASVHCVDLKVDRGEVPQRYFDAITLLDVIEHLDDPRVYLKRLAECARPDGLLLISTPNIESFNARLYKSRWILHTPPYHICYFGPRSIEVLLRETGWTVVRWRTERTIFHNERSGRETWRGRTFRALFQNRPFHVVTNRALRIGSIMTVMAKRS